MRSDAWQIEANYVPETLDDAVELHERVVEAGFTRSIAAGLVMWVSTKASGSPNDVTSHTKSTYRKVLAQLQRSGYPGPSGRVRSDIPGYRDTRTLVAA